LAKCHIPNGAICGPSGKRSGNDTLIALVDEYVNNCLEDNENKMNYFPLGLRFDELIRRSAYCRSFRNGQEICANHQRRVRRNALAAFHRALLSRRVDIEAAGSFAEIITILDSARPKGIGDLTVFDAATRIGHWRSIEPELVYLHRGAAEGAKVFGITGRSVLPSRFPREVMERLKPSHIENFLCIFKDRLRPLPRG
jgi:hypothetical protein